MYQGKFLAENKAAAKDEQQSKIVTTLTADQIMDEELAAQVDVEIPAAEAKATPAKPSKEKKAKKGKKKKGIRVGTVIFYLLY